MFYTKYRPQKFSDLVGLETLSKTILSALTKGKISHAYFFSGPRGSGKTTTARLIAKAVNCTNRSKDGEPCGKCDSCAAIQEGRHLDLIEIDAASNRGIDDIRSLREKINLAPTQSTHKIYIIDEVHMLTTEAFNALLKTLEEPPEHAIFVLCTTEPHKVPETIRSRCQRFEFKRASSAQLLKKLKRICKEEKAEVSDEDLQLIIKAANGGYRDAETYLEQVIVGGQSVKDVLGTLEADAPEALLDFIIKGDSKGGLLFINKLFDEGANLVQFTHDFLDYLRQIMLVQAGVGDELIEATEDQYANMGDQASELSSDQVGELIEEFSKAENRMKDAVIPQLPLELAVLECIKVQPRGLGVGPFEENSGGDASNPGAKDRHPELDSESRRLESSQPSRFRNKFGMTDGESSSSSDPGELGREVTLQKITSNWDEFLKKLKPLNHSLSALLRSSRPKECREDGTLVLEMFYKFHKERIESARNRKMLEGVLEEVVQVPVKIRCILGEKSEVASRKAPLDEARGLRQGLRSASRGKSATRKAVKLYNGRIE